MRPPFRTGFYVGLGFILALALYLTWLWRPERQIGLHTQHLLRKIEHRDWAGVGDFLAADYSDQWGDDRNLVLERLRQAFGYVRNVHLDAIGSYIITDGDHGDWRAQITVSAEGEFADLLKERVNSLKTPFQLTWRRVSAKPWDWRLVHVSNPELEVPAGLIE